MSHLAIGGHAGPMEVLGGLPEADLAQRPLYEVSWSMCAGCAEKPRFGVRGALPGGASVAHVAGPEKPPPRGGARGGGVMWPEDGSGGLAIRS